MKIIIEDPEEGAEEQIIIRCREMSDDLLRLIRFFKTPDHSVFGYSGDQIHRIAPKDVYYFEAVDNKVFLYCQKEVFETKRKLYELEEELAASNFVRVSKSVILNIGKIRRLRPAFNGRFETELDNGETVIISRQYVGDLKKRLGL